MPSYLVRTGVAAMLGMTSFGQNLTPVINPRGVVNAYTQQPAPSQVSPGSILWINGLNLGPFAGVKADGFPLPTQIGDLQVMIDGRPAPIISADAARIVVQVPFETPAGLQNVVVRRGEVASRPARVNIINILPAVPNLENKGFGEVAGTTSGRRFTFEVSGLGISEPRTATGELGVAGSKPRMPATVHVGGIPVDGEISPSAKVPGSFDITVELPESTLPGDIVTVEAVNRLANLGTYRQMTRPETTFIPMPSGAPELRSLTGSDLRGGFLLASGTRNDEGCWPSVLFDIRAKKANNVGDCLTTANRNALTPAVATMNGAPIAALVGPPQGDGTPGAGVSSKVMVFQPSNNLKVELPSLATQLIGSDSTNFAALLAGTPPQIATIDTNSGQVAVGGQAGLGIGLVPGGGVGAGGGAGGGALNPLTLQVDLGGGLNKLLTIPANVGQAQFAVLVGDDEDNPKQAKLAILNPQGEVTAQRDFNANWLPMVMPNAPAQAPGGGGLPGGGPGGIMIPPGGVRPGGGGVVIIGVGEGGGALAAVRFRVGTFVDTQTRTLYVQSRKADDSQHGLTAFGFGNNATQTIPTPEKWFIAGCTPTAQILSIDTSRRLALMGTNIADREFKRVCGALGFLVYDLGATTMTAVELPGAGQVNATAGVDDINDFLLAANTEGDTMFVLDGATATAYRLDLPQGVLGFAGLVTVPTMQLAIATARLRQNGDAGFLIFDIENVATRQLLIPDGFAAVQQVGLLPATRKLVAKGNKTGGTGSQFIVYDLLSGDVQMIDNPPGVAFVGNVPPQPAQPGGQPQQQAPAMQRVNNKANTIEAITFGEDRRQNGAMLVRVH